MKKYFFLAFIALFLFSCQNISPENIHNTENKNIKTDISDNSQKQNLFCSIISENTFSCQFENNKPENFVFENGITSYIFYINGQQKIEKPQDINNNTIAYILYRDDCNPREIERGKIKILSSQNCSSNSCNFSDEINNLWGVYYPRNSDFDPHEYDKTHPHKGKNNLDNVLKNSDLSNPINPIFTRAQEPCIDNI